MLEQLAQYHTLWISYVINNCNEGFYTEDIVQEMYLKAHRTKNKKEIIKNGEVNKSYVFRILSTLTMDYHRAKSRVKKKESLDITQEVDYQPIGMDLETIKEIHDQHLENRRKLKNHHGYYEQLYLKYTDCKQKQSFRKLAKGTGINYNTLWNDLQDAIKILKTG